MPIGSDPSDTVPVVLKIDRQRSEPKPTFRVRFLTDRESRRAMALLRAAQQAAKDDPGGEDDEPREDAKLRDLFALALDGWDNVTFRGEAMEHGTHYPGDFLSAFEKWELANECVMAGQITERDRRNFVSPSGHGGAASATAPAASASTPPPPTPPSA